jgi:hypothetical protein
MNSGGPYGSSPIWRLELGYRGLRRSTFSAQRRRIQLPQGGHHFLGEKSDALLGRRNRHEPYLNMNMISSVLNALASSVARLITSSGVPHGWLRKKRSITVLPTANPIGLDGQDVKFDFGGP